jgi:transposase
MMGRHAKQNELWSEPVNLARRIPPDHPLRKLRETIKLEFVREEVAASYGRKGNVSVASVIVMKMMLLLFWDNVRSERELMRIIPLRIDYLWFLGYSLEDEIPNHSVLSKARRRWGAEVFTQLFRQSVEQCLEAGLIEGNKLHTDSTRVARVTQVTRVTGPWMTKPESSPPSRPLLASAMMGRSCQICSRNTRRTQPINHTRSWPTASMAQPRTSSPWRAKGFAPIWVTCAAGCATTTRGISILRSALSMMRAATLTSVRRAASFIAITSTAIAVTMTIARDRECARAVSWPPGAPVPRPGAV